MDRPNSTVIRKRRRRLIKAHEHPNLKYLTIGTDRDDGDIGVCATFNNMDDQMEHGRFITMVNDVMLQYIDAGEDIHWWERQDASDYVTP